MADDVIPELALGYARLGGYEAAVGRANLQTRRDAAGAWLVGERDTGLIRSLTSKQVVAEYGPELADLNLGRRVSASQLGKGGWWKTRTGLARSEPLAQAFGPGVPGVKLGDRAFIVHREAMAAAATPATPASPAMTAASPIAGPSRPLTPPPLITPVSPIAVRPSTPPPPLEDEDVISLLLGDDEKQALPDEP